jgi:hypothetical protein
VIQPFAEAKLLFAAASCRLVCPSLAALLRSGVDRLIQFCNNCCNHYMILSSSVDNFDYLFYHHTFRKKQKNYDIKINLCSLSLLDPF